MANTSKPQSKSTSKPQKKARSVSVTKTAVIEAFAAKAGISKTDAKKYLESLAEVVQTTLKVSGNVQIPGIAKLKVVDKPARAAREGINPFTKEKIKIAAKPASKKIKISPTTVLKDLF